MDCCAGIDLGMSVVLAAPAVEEVVPECSRHLLYIVCTQDQKKGAASLGGIGGIERIFSNIVAAVIGFAGIVLFIMLIIGGLQWATAGGDPKKAEMARKTLTSAIIGLVLVAMALLIIRLIESFTGVTVSEFVIFQK